MNIKKIMLSLGVIVFVGAVAASATGAFFSDEETSTGNTFTAGSIDLQLGSSFDSNANGSGEQIVQSDNNGRFLIQYSDLKPGDRGEGRYIVRISSNDAYACLKTDVLATPENGVNEPESDVPDTTTGDDEGELQNFVQFAFFADHNDNGVFNSGIDSGLNNGPDGNGFTVAELDAFGWAAIAQSGPTSNTFLGTNALIPGEDHSLGFISCFGDIESDGSCTSTTDPDVNVSQTDSFEGAIQFYSVQTRNNPEFLCGDLEDESIDLPQEEAPVIDGIISDGEYEGALSMEIANAGGGDVKAKTQGGFLYLAADIITDTTDNRTISGFNDEFGVNLDEAPDTDAVFLGLGSTNANGRTVGTVDGYFTNFDTTGHELKALFTSGHRVIEWKIPLSAVPGIAVGDTLTIGGATESTDGNTAVYPIGLNFGVVGTYGSLVVTP